MKITKFNRRSYFYKPWTMHFSYARKPRGPLPKGEPRFRNINGIALFLPTKQFWFEFRRVS